MSAYKWTDAELERPPTAAECRRSYYRWAVIARSHIGRYLCHAHYANKHSAVQFAKGCCGTVMRIKLEKP